MPSSLCNTMSPRHEMQAYETLWATRNASLKTIAGLFRQSSAQLPSELLSEQADSGLFGDLELDKIGQDVKAFLDELTGISVCLRMAFEYPKRLQDAKYPLEMFYYRGDIGYLDSPCVSVVGARSASNEGIRRAAKLAEGLVANGFTIVSGLARGIDTAAMTAAIRTGGRTIGVIGTPLTESYPKENASLQELVAQQHLLISQVPFVRYRNEPFSARKRYFPERNETMAAISNATVIVEASDRSGTLTQARACMQQGRKLFILNSCFERDDISWPQHYLERGAIRVRELDDILAELGRGDESCVQLEED